MLDYLYLHIGCYHISLPSETSIEITHTQIDANIPNQHIHTFWKIKLNRFFLSVHLTPTHGLADLKKFIDSTTKSNVNVSKITVNDIAGVKYGSYDGARTWLDWWFKKFDVTLCINLQSTQFPQTTPTNKEIEQHINIINSIKYIGASSMERL